VVTFYALCGEEKKARAAGCDDYVPKALQPAATAAENKAISLLSVALIAAVHESETGTKRTSDYRLAMSAFGGKADMART
jgi:CheY-like chemotaxis protein